MSKPAQAAVLGLFFLLQLVIPFVVQVPVASFTAHMILLAKHGGFLDPGRYAERLLVDDGMLGGEHGLVDGLRVWCSLSRMIGCVLCSRWTISGGPAPCPILQSTYFAS